MSYSSKSGRAIYGTSTVDSRTSSSKPPSRRDSTAPLINTPPIPVTKDPLRGTLRRRKNEESESESESEEENTRELNTSDEEDSEESSDDDEDEDEEDTNTENNTIYNLTHEVRISGLTPRDARAEQDLLLVDEDVHIRITGYKFNPLKLLLYRLSSVLSLGIVWLVCRWVPKWYVSWVGIPVTLKKAEWLVFEVSRLFKWWCYVLT